MVAVGKKIGSQLDANAGCISAKRVFGASLAPSTAGTWSTRVLETHRERKLRTNIFPSAGNSRMDIGLSILL